MSVIQSIRDKYIRYVVFAIALALIGFIAMDATQSSRRAGGNSSSVGSVNGESIDLNEFNNLRNAREQQLRNSGMPSDAVTERASDAAWDNAVAKILLEQQADKLGLVVTDKEMNNSVLFGPHPAQAVMQQFTNEQGMYDPEMELATLKNVEAKGDATAKAQLHAFMDELVLGRLQEKYNSLVLNALYVPKWMVEKEMAFESQQARISLVKKNYTEVPDSLVKISDEEISDYISKHKNDFKQVESRSIAYVNFSAAPSSEDSAAVKTQLEGLTQGFQEAQDPAIFITRNGGTADAMVYETKAAMTSRIRDTVQTLAVGSVFGPYVDANGMTLAKLIDKKVLPDSVKCRHIIIATIDQNGQPLGNDSIAEKTIDSIKTAIDNGASWKDMAAKYNSDGTRATGGEMTFSSQQIQTPGGFDQTFGKFVLFDGKPGDKKVLKSAFGYHYVEIMQFIKPEQQYKVAYLSKNINTSDKTENAAQAAASQFASEARDEKAFNDVFDKKLKPQGLVKGIGQYIMPSSYSVPGVGYSRDFVKKVYDADQGEVMDPTKVGDNYVVAVVTGVYKEGTQSVATARMAVEPLLRNKKKAEQIEKEIGNYSTLEEVAQKLNKPVETIDSVRLRGSVPSEVSFESKVIGAATNPANAGKLIKSPIPGINAVYVVKVESVVAVPSTSGSVEDRRKAMLMQMQQMSQQDPSYYPLQAAREAATIKDRRSKFF